MSLRVLYIVPYPPSLIRVRPYQLIRHLRARGHHVTVATLWSNEAEHQDIQRLQAEGIDVIAAPLARGRIARNLLRALLTGLPMQAVYCETPALIQAIAHRWNGRGQAFDIIHVEHLRGARYGLLAAQVLDAQRHSRAAVGGRRSAVVYDSVDCISYLFAQAAQHSRSRKGRLMTRLELARTRRYEAWLVRQFDRVLVTSDVDRQALEALSIDHGMRTADSGRPAAVSDPRPAVEVLPNGVDLDYFTPTDEPREPAALVFSGKMSYHANITAALHLIQEVMPRVWAQRPDVQVWVVGKDPARELRQHATHDTPHTVRITGTVPDIRPYLRRATIAVSPLVYGAGIQNKVLEAMACATPVVTTPQATGALRAIDGEHLLIARDAESFAQHILRLLSEPGLRRRIGRAARRYVERHHDWDQIVGDLERIYASA